MNGVIYLPAKVDQSDHYDYKYGHILTQSTPPNALYETIASCHYTYDQVASEPEK